jgi:hypothetical protein
LVAFGVAVAVAFAGVEEAAAVAVAAAEAEAEADATQDVLSGFATLVGICSTWPTVINFTSAMLFNLAMSQIPVENRLARLIRVSPWATVSVTVPFADAVWVAAGTATVVDLDVDVDVFTLDVRHDVLSGLVRFVGTCRTWPMATKLGSGMLFSFTMSQMPELNLVAILASVSPCTTVTVVVAAAGALLAAVPAAAVVLAAALSVMVVVVVVVPAERNRSRLPASLARAGLARLAATRGRSVEYESLMVDDVTWCQVRFEF